MREREREEMKLTQDPVVEEDDAPFPRELRRSRFCGGCPGIC